MPDDKWHHSYPNTIDVGSGAWSIGSVRASGAVGTELEPILCHSLLRGGSLAGSCKLCASGAADLSSIRCVCSTKKKDGLINQEEAWNQLRRRKGRAFEHSSGHQEFIPNAGIYKKLCFHQRDEHHIEDLEWRTQLKENVPHRRQK